jgi:hypothetical protein
MVLNGKNLKFLLYFRKKHECLDWQYSQFINIVGKDDFTPAAGS